MITRNGIAKYRTTYGDNLEERILRRRKFKDACRRIRAEDKIEKEREKAIKKQEYAKKRKTIEQKLTIVREWFDIKADSSLSNRRVMMEELCERHEIKIDTVRKYARIHKKMRQI